MKRALAEASEIILTEKTGRHANRRRECEKLVERENKELENTNAKDRVEFQERVGRTYALKGTRARRRLQQRQGVMLRVQARQ